MTCVVVRKSRELAGHREDPVAWASVLRCCASFEAFRLRFHEPIGAAAVPPFLLLDRTSPRSAAYCAEQALTAVRQIEGGGAGSPPCRLLGQLSAIFEYAPRDTVAASPLPLGARVEEHLGHLQKTLRQTYFRPGQLALHVAGGDLIRQPQQQQQASMPAGTRGDERDFGGDGPKGRRPLSSAAVGGLGGTKTPQAGHAWQATRAARASQRQLSEEGAGPGGPC